MNSLELFSGAGGLAKGLEFAGFEHLAFVEFNRDACDTLRRNFDPSKVFEGDVRDYDFSCLTKVDVVAGGPPCQPFSIGGKHKASDDQRDMFPYAFKAISVLRPRAFIFENVKGLLRPTFSEYFQYIILGLEYPDHADGRCLHWQDHLEKLRELSQCHSTAPEYQVKYKLINTADYGIPQMRERVIIVGLRSDMDCELQFPEGEYNLDRLLWDQFVSGDYWERHGLNPINYQYSENFMKKANGIEQKYGLIPPDGKPWITIRDAIGHLPEPDSRHNIPDHVFRGGARSYVGHTGSVFDLPSKAIKAGGHGVPGGENMIRFCDGSNRYLTVHEAKLIQGFPENFIIHGAWGEAMRQIGNAVPILVGQKIGDAINEIISKGHKRRAA
ncbi:MAG: DNA cytosine methyltransferase [Candidatus Porifericomitaceae bacterium WSBS_2022_MAG_OTU9]